MAERKKLSCAMITCNHAIDGEALLNDLIGGVTDPAGESWMSFVGVLEPADGMA
jgi:hypothetical protein